MKKITSVFITALVFLFSFVSTIFSAITGENTNESIRINRKNEIPSGKIEDLAKLENLNKNVTIEEGKIESLEYKLQDLSKYENLDKNVTVEAGKLEDLTHKVNDLEKFENLDKNLTVEQGKIDELQVKLDDLGKIDDLGKNTTTVDIGLNFKLNNLENKR
jgi:predicted  nucleic acid-binding Zn-ribbon protein